MINLILWLFFCSTLGFVFVIVIESQMERLSPDNKFRRWWKNNIIGDDIYGDDF